MRRYFRGLTVHMNGDVRRRQGKDIVDECRTVAVVSKHACDVVEEGPLRVIGYRICRVTVPDLVEREQRRVHVGP